MTAWDMWLDRAEEEGEAERAKLPKEHRGDGRLPLVYRVELKGNLREQMLDKRTPGKGRTG